MTRRSERLVVGVDGGGTRTVALVGFVGAGALGEGNAGSANPQSAGFDTAVDHLETAIRAALQTAAADGQDRIDRLVLGIAGASHPADRARLRAMLAARLPVAETAVHVVLDVALVLPAAGLAQGVALVAGTGSSAFGVAPDGRSVVGGGWGYLIGDEGSAFDVGRQALRALALAHDGQGPTTRLTDRIVHHFAVAGPRDLIPAVYQARSPRTTIADLAPLVVEVAQAGDPEARRVLARAGRSLAGLACAVSHRLGLDREAPVVCSGGLALAGELFLNPLRRGLRRGGLTDFRILREPAAIGALRLATGEVALPDQP